MPFSVKLTKEFNEQFDEVLKRVKDYSGFQKAFFDYCTNKDFDYITWLTTISEFTQKFEDFDFRSQINFKVSPEEYLPADKNINNSNIMEVLKSAREEFILLADGRIMKYIKDTTNENFNSIKSPFDTNKFFSFSKNNNSEKKEDVKEKLEKLEKKAPVPTLSLFWKITGSVKAASVNTFGYVKSFIWKKV